MADLQTASNFLAKEGPIFDVRSPQEYDKGHIPGAINLPLLNNDERAKVGTVYKKIGRQEAFLLGLELIGPKLASLVEVVQTSATERKARVYCWRGGMRSESVANLLKMAAIQVETLPGGYKRFRNWALAAAERSLSVIVVGGFTGSGKTSILSELKKRGEQILDLEAIAKHRGSSYGMIGEPGQPTQEHFENEIAMQWASFEERRVWIEDESRLIGTCRIPQGIFKQMLEAPTIQIERPREERLKLLAAQYYCYSTSELVEATERLRKKLGGAKTAQTIELIYSKDPRAIELLLDYYDRAYSYSLTQRPPALLHLKKEGLSTAEWADLILKFIPAEV